MPPVEAHFDPFKLSGKDGKPSIIFEYCARAQASGRYGCLWVCFQEHNKTRAKDVSIDLDADTFDLSQLTKCRGWWKRLSMHSVVGIRQVEIEFHHVTKDNKVYAFASPVDHTHEVQQIDETIDYLRTCIGERGVCGISSEGKVHGPKEPCPNAMWDEDNNIVCPVRDMYQQKCLRDKVRSAPAALQFYWNTRKSPTLLTALREAGLICTYEDLQTLRFYDAMKPYGRSVKCIELVQGWRQTYITMLVVISILLSICITALTALATHDLNCGWAAGSYSAAIIAILLAFFTLLSGIL